MVTGATSGPLTQLSSFVGRTDEVVELRRLLHSARLLTLTGPAGVGKTRLAMEVAAQDQRSRHCEVAVVELDGVADAHLMRKQIAVALGQDTETGAAPVPPQPASEAGGKDCLLVLNDCEHVLDECAALLSELWPTHPELRVLATSREPLRLPAEAVYSVCGLTLPDPDGESDLAECLRSYAASLFVDRARAVVPDFRLTKDNAAYVSAICTRLDGLPLSIELAARLIRVFPLAEINARLDDRLSLLTNGWRLAAHRHRSLRASLEWGYDLLGPAEQSVFRKLAVLPGGFGPDAAAAVVADENASQSRTPEFLVALEAKSLVTLCTGQTGPARFRLLESTRYYGHDRLVAEGEDHETYNRLVAWLTTLATPLQQETVVQPAVLERLEEERGNLIHALHWLSAGDDERQLLLAGALAMVEMSRGPTGDVLALLSGALDRTPAQSPYRSVALEGAAALAGWQADYDAAANYAAQAVELERGYGRDRLFARLLLLSCALREMRDDQDGALAHLQECLTISRRLHDETLTSLCLGGFARHLLLNGELARARRMIERALPVLRTELSLHWRHVPLITAGALALEEGDLPKAEEYFAESLRSAAGHPPDEAGALEGLAMVAMRAYQFEKGLRLMGVAEKIGPSGPWGGAWWEERVSAARASALKALPVRRADAALEAGHAVRQHCATGVEWELQGMDPGGADGDNPLSQRERDVTALVVEGLTNRQIAARLHVSVRTVETHIRHIRTALGLRSRAHIAAWAAERRSITGSGEHEPPLETASRLAGRL